MTKEILVSYGDVKVEPDKFYLCIATSDITSMPSWVPDSFDFKWFIKETRDVRYTLGACFVDKNIMVLNTKLPKDSDIPGNVFEFSVKSLKVACANFNVKSLVVPISDNRNSNLLVRRLTRYFTELMSDVDIDIQILYLKHSID